MKFITFHLEKSVMTSSILLNYKVVRLFRRNRFIIQLVSSICQSESFSFIKLVNAIHVMTYWRVSYEYCLVEFIQNSTIKQCLLKIINFNVLSCGSQYFFQHGNKLFYFSLSLVVIQNWM